MFALGMVEVLSVPAGVLAGDAMLKAAEVALVMAQTVCAGKYIVLVSGEVAAVKSAVEAGVAHAERKLVDSMVIPNVDRRVVAALSGAGEIETVQAVGVLETFSLAAAVRAADTAVKAAAVELVEVRLARGMGGKSFVLMTGEVAAVEAAVQAAQGDEAAEGMLAQSVVIPAPHPDMIRALL
ncbi:MAG: BMC domain-containing protein [Oscillospiraceae bacterium]|jgi:microcompartment protein CcmL/EutN|nr:BMC domain-containing protein [Oscillospiraceae bacterium]